MAKSKKLVVDRRIILLIAALIFIFIGLLIIKAYSIKKLPQTGQVDSPAPSLIADASFSCDDNKTIQADFYPNQVMLRLSDGRNLTVPGTIC
jgi:hypothetical protein